MDENFGQVVAEQAKMVEAPSELEGETARSVAAVDELMASDPPELHHWRMAEGSVHQRHRSLAGH